MIWEGFFFEIFGCVKSCYNIGNEWIMQNLIAKEPSLCNQDGGMVGWWLEWYGREQKVGSAEKKLRLTQKNGASCVSRVACTYLWAAFVWGVRFK